jgi:ABC-type transporter lipoprotein component MlaA
LLEFDVDEFLEPLSKKYCCFKDEYEKFRNFTFVATGIKERQEKKRQIEENNQKNKKR